MFSARSETSAAERLNGSNAAGSPPVLPQITVITPAYNVAKYIGESIDSVLGQTFRNFEYLVIDDGSTDNTIEVARAHGGHDSRFRVVQVEHRGLSAVRNIGIRESRAEYIAYLDGDDRWHKRFLERQLALMESVPANVGAVFCRSFLTLESGTKVFAQWQRSGSYDYEDLLVANNPARNGSSLLIRKSCFTEVGGFDDNFHRVEDLEMWLRIAERSKTPVLWGSKHFLVDLRLRPGSVTRDRSTSQTALNDLLDSCAPKLQRLPAGLAYVRPAVAALKYGGDEDLAEMWAAKARTAGIAQAAAEHLWTPPALLAYAAAPWTQRCTRNTKSGP